MGHLDDDVLRVRDLCDDPRALDPLSSQRLTVHGLDRLPDRPFDIVTLSFRRPLLSKFARGERPANLILRHAVRKGIHGIGQVDPISVAPIPGVATKLVDAFRGALLCTAMFA
jgi:hypothetical protein